MDILGTQVTPKFQIASFMIASSLAICLTVLIAKGRKNTLRS